MKLTDWITNTSNIFARAGFDQPQMEARQVAQAVLKWTPADLLVQTDYQLQPSQVKIMEQWSQKRLDGVPLAYLTGLKGFYKNDFLVEPGVLVPRPETEIIIDVALKRKDPESVKFIADLGCGTGCIGLTLVQEFKGSRLYAIDRALSACTLTAVNATRLNLIDRVHVFHATVMDWQPKHQFDLVVANPPYIALNDPNVQSGVHQHEPHEALYSGATGLESIVEWAERTWDFLRPGGLMVFEMGAGQSSAVRKVIERLGFSEIEFTKDLADIERVVSAIKPRS